MTEINDFRAKVSGCWLGKSAGGTLGMPFEGYPGMNNLTYYDPVPTVAIPNDDLELQVMYAAALDRMPEIKVNREILADIWLKHNAYYCDEYAVAICNLRRGIRPPYSGKYDNCFYDGMGAAIRSELWACLAPGNPRLAAALAYEDGIIDHAEDGVYAEMFLGAVESQAFIESNIEKLIETGLSVIPENCLIHRAITDTCALWEKSGDWKSVRNKIYADYSSEFATCVLVNVPFIVLALLAGKGDFGKSICIAANCGMDTDCTAATTGSILGIISPDSIDEKWSGPLGNELIVRKDKIVKLDNIPQSLDALTDLVISLREKLEDFTIPDELPAPEWTQHSIQAEICALPVLHWWHIPMCSFIGQWESIPLPGHNNVIDLQKFHETKQLLLKIKFRIDVEGEYSIMFNTPSSCQIYLDPDWKSEALHDSRDMLFGRSTPFLGEKPEGRFQSKISMCNTIFNPCLNGAPLNQIKRYLRLTPGMHELLISIVPEEGEKVLKWCMGIGKTSTCELIDAFRF